jgi:hypothetical protein
MARKIIHSGSRIRRVEPHEIAETLGGRVMGRAPDFGGDPIGMIAQAGWFAQRQKRMREMKEEAGFRVGDHIRIWPKGTGMSCSGRVMDFPFPDGRTRFVIDGTDGKWREFLLGDVDRIQNFGSLLPPGERPRFGRPKRVPKRRGGRR